MTFPAKPFFDRVYEGDAPWDVGAPQPDLMALIEEFPPEGRILDLGCGTGDLAIGLARAGHEVVAIDFAETAIEVARTRAQELSAGQRALVHFEIADALKPSAYAGRVGAIVDSGFYHLFDAETRRALVAELAVALPPGGRYYMLGFGISIPADEVPRQVTADEIAALFSTENGWTLKACRAARFQTVGFDAIPALAVCAERRANT
jgi:SAM-dependent methyltransferase